MFVALFAMAADRPAGDRRGCCPRNEPEQMASSKKKKKKKKLMLYINKLELHEWMTTISPVSLCRSPGRTPCKHTPGQTRHTKDRGIQRH